MKKLPADCAPMCATCRCADFSGGVDEGECHLLPMDWVPVGDGTALARWKPAMLSGWCRHYERKLSA